MILAVVPSRMGSVRMPRKNLCDIAPGLTLVQHAIDCARHSGLIDHIAVTSDSAIPFNCAEMVMRPRELSGPTADIADAVHHATVIMEARYNCIFDYVVTLQPAVLARSPLIVRRLLDHVRAFKLRGGLTMATTHRWIWRHEEERAFNDWHGHPYPRSQDGGQRLVEINAVQIAARDVVMERKRWDAPLAILELPSWSAALDIDTPSDLQMARDLWPWAHSRLETWEGVIHQISEVSACV